MSDLDAKFQELARLWRAETLYLSDSSKIIFNDNYLKIVGMGPDVLPLILAEMLKAPDHWGPALQWITCENPVPEEFAGNLGKIYAAWIQWGIEKGLLEEPSTRFTKEDLTKRRSLREFFNPKENS